MTKCLGKHKLVWSTRKDETTGIVTSGWFPKLIQPEEEAIYSRKLLRGYEREEFESTGRDDLTILRSAENEIQFGDIGGQIDQLPNFHKQMLYATDAWHISQVGNGLFKIVDELTQVYEFGEWGSDADDEDIQVNGRTTSARLFLEQSKIIEPEEDDDRVTDILGAIEFAEYGDKEYRDTGCYSRIDTEVGRISVMPSESFVDSEQEENDDCITADDEELSLRDNRMINSALPKLPKEAIEKIKKIKEEFNIILAKCNDINEEDTLLAAYERALDKAINHYITTPFNSPLCGRGYSAPRRKHLYIPIQRESDLAEAATERIERFNALFGEAAQCSTQLDLFGPLVRDKRPVVNGEPNKNYGTTSRPGGFYGKIREMHNHDKALFQRWSIEDYTTHDGIFVRSAFNQARKEFIDTWREKKQGDEESLRIALWAWFDRKQGKTPAIYSDDEEKKLIKPAKNWKDSIWRQRRTTALKELFLTKRQWDAIYKMLSIVRNRIKLQAEITKERTNTLAILADVFKKIDNLFDLRVYIRWALKREFIHETTISRIRKSFRTNQDIPVYSGPKVNTYDFKPSLIDRISILDEMRWKRSCEKKRRYLEQRLFIFNRISESIKSTLPTDLPEEATTCYDPKCANTVIGKPEYAELENGKGLLFITCETCGEPVWLISHKENPTPKTLEELIKNRNN